MSDYAAMKLAQEREENARALRMAHEEIDMLKREKAALELERDNMLKERSGGWHDRPEWPDSEPFEYEAMGPALGEYNAHFLSSMSAKSRAAFVGRVSMLLYRYMGDSPHAQAMAIMKDLTGEPS